MGSLSRFVVVLEPLIEMAGPPVQKQVLIL